LDRANDRVVFQYAKENDFIIVTKDSDYSDLNLLLGYPPKVIWIRRGNCSTDAIEEILRKNIIQIDMLFNDKDLGIVTIF
jgi:predicted nuclease of predicted toxin-antitoxin system